MVMKDINQLLNLSSIGVSAGVFQNWIKQYEFSGEAAFEKRYTSNSVEFKLDVLNYMKEQRTSIRETVAIFNNLSPKTHRGWKIAFETQGLDALQTIEKGASLIFVIRMLGSLTH